MPQAPKLTTPEHPCIDDSDPHVVPNNQDQTAPGISFGKFQNVKVLEDCSKTLRGWALGIRLMCGQSGVSRRSLRGQKGGVFTFAFSADGSMAVSGSTTSSVQVWDATKNAHHKILRGHTDGINTSVAFSPCGIIVASASWDCTCGSGTRQRVQNIRCSRLENR